VIPADGKKESKEIGSTPGKLSEKKQNKGRKAEARELGGRCRDPTGAYIEGGLRGVMQGGKKQRRGRKVKSSLTEDDQGQSVEPPVSASNERVLI